MPECRANNLPGWTQGGSSADYIVGHFAINYHNEAADLGIDLEELYEAMVADSENNPFEWDIQGRESNMYNLYGFVPFSVLDPSSTGRQTREGSRTLEYAFEDFAIRQVALLLNKTSDVERYTNKSMHYLNVWDSTVKSDGFTGFMQHRWPNGTFQFTDPIDCSPVDPDVDSRECSLQPDNEVGFYESSSWEYSWFVPHDTGMLVELMGGNNTFLNRLDHFFSKGYFQAGNEPSFQTPIGYHYADRPSHSIDRVREVIFNNFDTSPAGLPGNDDQAAMASLVVFHLLGLYPVPSTSQFLVLSPFTPKYTIHNDLLGVSTTVTAAGWDSRSIKKKIAEGVSAYVSSVTINGQPAASRCHFDFYDTFRIGANVTIQLVPDGESVDDCAGPVPESLSTGGWATVR